MKSLPIATVALLLLTGVSTASPASADEGRKPASCDHRVCLRVVDPASDADGDGVTDLDEKAFGTDPRDAASFPAGQKLIDQALMRELPSFESHLTELVVLPQMTTDFSALATAVGLMDLPTASWGTKNAPGLLADLQQNGLTGILSAWGVRLPGSAGHELPEGSDSSYFAYLQRVKDGTGSTSFGDDFGAQGLNQGKSGGISILSDFQGIVGDLTVWAKGYWDTSYPDGTKDSTRFENWGSVTNLNETGSNFWTQSLGKEGSAYTTGVSKTQKDPETGARTTTGSYTTTYYDKKGTAVGQATTKYTTTVKDGVKTTNSTTTTTDAKGNKTVTKTTTEEKCETKDCSEGMVDPDYVTFGPLTPDDYRKVMVRLGEVRTPGPDSGILTDNPPQIPTRDIYANYSGDGVVVLSATPSPRFNIAQPEYNGELAEMAQLGGTVPPNPNADDPTGYWPDKP